MCRLHPNTTPFYVVDLSSHTFWYLWGVPEPISLGYRGTTVFPQPVLPCPGKVLMLPVRIFLQGRCISVAPQIICSTQEDPRV